MIDKNCEMCGKLMYNVVHNKKRCTECNKIYTKQYNKNYLTTYYDNNKEYSYEECLSNFEKLINSNRPSLLCPSGFTANSKISAISTTKILKNKWFKLLENHNKINELYEYVKEEYIKHYKRTNNSSVEKFVHDHDIITQDVLKYFGNNNLKNDCGFTRKGLYNKSELKKYFIDLVEKLEYVPTYVEFMNKSDIKVYQFISLFSEDNSWDSVVKNIVTVTQYNDYLERVKTKNIETSKKGGSTSKLDECFIEEEFRRVFDYCFNNYGIYPTRRLFNELSTLSDGAYRKRYKESWNETVKRYGYPVKNNNPSEKYVLGLVREITGVEYKSQMKWDWLVSDKKVKLPVDGYFEALNLVVEFDGAQHRKPLVNMGGASKYERQVINDRIKDIEIPKNGIKLIRISSNSKWYDKDYIREILIKNNIPILTPTS